MRGISPIQARAAMYMMIKIDIEEFADIVDDIDFCKKLLAEEYCMVLPSQCFFAKNFFRIVTIYLLFLYSLIVDYLHDDRNFGGIR